MNDWLIVITSEGLEMQMRADRGGYFACRCCGRESRNGKQGKFGFCDAVCSAIFEMLPPAAHQVWRASTTNMVRGSK